MAYPSRALVLIFVILGRQQVSIYLVSQFSRQSKKSSRLLVNNGH